MRTTLLGRTRGWLRRQSSTAPASKQPATPCSPRHLWIQPPNQGPCRPRALSIGNNLPIQSVVFSPCQCRWLKMNASHRWNLNYCASASSRNSILPHLECWVVVKRASNPRRTLPCIVHPHALPSNLLSREPIMPICGCCTRLAMPNSFHGRRTTELYASKYLNCLNWA